MKDAIALLKADHATVKGLFSQFEKLGDRAEQQKKEIVKKIVHELSVHAAIEEQIFYPAVRKELPQFEDDVLEALEEHHVAKWLLAELDTMRPSHERFDAKVTVLMESIRHHIEEEEDTLFPEVSKKLGAEELGRIGEALAVAKKTAPSHPHPGMSDTPPGNVVLGLGASMFDRARDFVQKVTKTKATKPSAGKKSNGVAAKVSAKVEQGKKALTKSAALPKKMKTKAKAVAGKAVKAAKAIKPGKSAHA